jgi:hypothetical protein
MNKPEIDVLYIAFGILLFGGLGLIMLGYGMAERGIFPDSLNLIMLGGVSIGILCGWIFKEIHYGEWDEVDTEKER